MPVPRRRPVTTLRIRNILVAGNVGHCGGTAGSATVTFERLDWPATFRSLMRASRLSWSAFVVSTSLVRARNSPSTSLRASSAFRCPSSSFFSCSTVACDAWYFASTPFTTLPVSWSRSLCAWSSWPESWRSGG